MAPKSSGSKGTKSKRAKVVAKKKSGALMLVVGAATVLVAVVGGAAYFSGSGKAKEPPAAEKKYLGRYLPAGYRESKLTDNIRYTTTTKMATVQSTAAGQDVSVEAGDVIQNKIVYFEYRKAAGQAIPMIAYIKPSGKLFVGVSYCPPCQGKYQRIESDGALTCETCGTKRDLETQVGISGACQQYPLDEMPAKVVGGKITLAKSDLDRYSPQPLDRPIGG
ncbi:MAG: DUF2318 domain-containing protein [Chloroflexi bacterium]|nr:DUF2318 domain-containing protein [Chloroflexota bacterium]